MQAVTTLLKKERVLRAVNYEKYFRDYNLKIVVILGAVALKSESQIWQLSLNKPIKNEGRG